jgi:hypothetical protein
MSLPIEQRPHLANGLIADPCHDATDLVQYRLDRLALGAPVGLRVRQLEGDRTDLVRLTAVAQRVCKPWVVLHAVDARPHIDEGAEHHMHGRVFDALAIYPDLAVVADRVSVLLSGAYHRRSLSVL